MPDEQFDPKTVCTTLVKRGLLSPDKAKEILVKQPAIKKKLEKQRGGPQKRSVSGNNSVTIVDVIASMKLGRKDGQPGMLDEDAVFQVLAQEWNIPYRKLDPLQLDLNLVTTTIPRNFAMKHLVLPIGIKDGYVTVATPTPPNLEVLDDITRVTNLKVKTIISSKTDVIKLINEFFGFKRSIAAAEDMFAGPSVEIGNLEQYVRLKSTDEIQSTDHHIVNAVNHLLLYAFDQRASDIHIEPKRDEVMVRMRIDGVLHTVYKLPKKVHNPIVSRIKTLSRLNIAEKRRPQDGRIKTDKGGVEVEIRISTVPVAFGEKVVMRVMDPDILFQDLEGLGFSATDLSRYDQFINMPHGIVLVCGPTGSGKSTTLYSTLRQLSTPENNVITVEDPIEMIHEDFNQIGVQPAIDVTFANILRTILRQDPDIIMVGEMRDLETARNAVQAALTGHLVLSTLHTNDAPSSITRLLDLGIPAFLLQATLVGILAQRLVRKICKYCAESFEIDTAELQRMGLEVGKKGHVALKRGKGCMKCRHTGYRGRTGIFEVLPYTEGLKKMTTAKTDVEKLKVRAREEGMFTLRESAVKKLLDGVTTYQEVLRVTWEQL
ncbi:MAG: type II/IV secretion system protein [Deltaproteobacteria bacterium]|nr:MAG: type II/IV secretion system protein [Deltaproteobacteria bacterium]